MTYATFVNIHREFEHAPSELVEAALASATLLCTAGVWGDKRGDGIRFLAAHMLTIGPGGFGLRTETKETGYKATTYGAQYLALAKSVSLLGSRVAGTLY